MIAERARVPQPRESGKALPERAGSRAPRARTLGLHAAVATRL